MNAFSDCFEIIEWNEKNLDLDCNDYTRTCRAERAYAFLSDYFRLKILYNHGGIYLDTDNIIRKNFYEEIKEYSFVTSFIYDCALGTSYVAASKGNDHVKYLLGFYDQFNGYNVNNELYTDYFLKKNLRLNNKFQLLDNNTAIYPKEYFSSPSFSRNNYVTHLGIGSWRDSGLLRTWLRNIIKSNMFMYTLYDRYYVQPRHLKISPYYDLYKQHNR